MNTVEHQLCQVQSISGFVDLGEVISPVTLQMESSGTTPHATTRLLRRQESKNKHMHMLGLAGVNTPR